MKRQAAEKRGLWGQVFGVVRIAAQGKKGTAFFDALRAGGTIWNGCDRNTLQNVAIFPLAASAAIWNPHWNDTGKLFSDLLLQCRDAD